MPRTKGCSPNIKAWRAEQLINDLALGERRYADLAEEHSVAEQTVAYFAVKHRADIEAKKQNWSAQFDHIWSTKKENGLRLLTIRLEEIEHQIELIHEHA